MTEIRPSSSENEVWASVEMQRSMRRYLSMASTVQPAGSVGPNITAISLIDPGSGGKEPRSELI